MQQSPISTRSFATPTQTITTPAGTLPARPVAMPAGTLPARPVAMPAGTLPARSVAMPAGTLPARPVAMPAGTLPARPVAMPGGTLPMPTQTMATSTGALRTRLDQPSPISTEALPTARGRTGAAQTRLNQPIPISTGALPKMQARTVAVPTPGLVLKTLPVAPITAAVVTPQVGGGGRLKQLEGVGGGTVPNVIAQPTIAGPPVAIKEETPYSLLSQTVTLWDGNLVQVQTLIDLKYRNGVPIIDLKRLDVLLEIIGMLRTEGFENVLQFLSSPECTGPDYVLWEQPSMDEGRAKVARELVIQRAEEVGVKGVGKCRYCTSTELVFATRQLRSQDEPATIFVRCVLCHKQWRE